LSPYEGGIIAPATAVVAVTSKHLFRTRLTNIFNPAAFALVLSALLFDSGHSWWGALPDWSWFGAALLLAAGSYTAERVNKLPLVLSFLGAFYGLFTIASFTGSSAEVASVFRAPDFQAALFFAFFMLDDPPTCPIKYPDQVIFGLIAAGVSLAAFEIYGWLFYLLAGVLVANAWWAIQRTIRGRRRASRPTPETAPRSGEWARPRQRI
jgi:Na+-translocating ferredoxin:NAD+ oxidoreductase RnfD subunit